MASYSKVIEILKKLGGKALLQNLYDEIRRHEPKSAFQDVLQILMKLEIHGKVRVSSLDEERKIVELIEDAS